MRIRRSFSLRALLIGLTVAGLVASGIMTPVYARYQEQRIIQNLPNAVELQPAQMMVVY